MKVAGVAAVVTMLGSDAWAGAIPVARERLTVCLGGTTDIWLQYRAETVASSVFAKIGVRVQWRSLNNCPAKTIQVSLSRDQPASQHPGSLAYALPYEGTHIVVFVDRVRNTVKTPAVPYLLGHVVAHEVAHILQGVVRHSESGVMKADWSTDDYDQMEWKPLEFTRGDILLINRGLEVRAGRLDPGLVTAPNVSLPAGK